ncbi:MAG: protein translocase subunit SecD [Patescibacteria group bacterium]
MQKQRLIFWLILLLSVSALVIDLPSSYHLKTTIFNRQIDTVISRPFNFLNRFRVVKGLDLAGGVNLTFRAKLEDLPEESRQEAFQSLTENIERRVNFFGISEASVKTSRFGSDYRLLVEMPGVAEVQQAVALVGQMAELDFRQIVELPPEATASATIYDLFGKETGLTGRHLLGATVAFNPQTGQPEVSLEFNPEGKDLFAKITSESVGQPLAIFLDNVLLSAPQVKEPITDGRAVISGDFDLKEAKGMVSQLKAGALPVPIELIEQRQVGPTLGAESVQKSMKAGLIGLGLVLLFMALVYRWLGIVAGLGLLVYGLLTLALYKIIPVTLTLPGLTGFLLSVGMAVDSNILIFERMKEELKAGRPWNVAMELGFGRAWDSIRDANVCTLITCFLLFNPFNWSFLNTSGMVRGFALTLALGIFISLFTGVVVTRNFLRLLARKDNK